MDKFDFIMPKKKAKVFKTGGVSQCWFCHAQLQRVKGGFNFKLLVDPLGNQLRVHARCVSKATGGGFRALLEGTPRDAFAELQAAADRDTRKEATQRATREALAR